MCRAQFGCFSKYKTRRDLLRVLFFQMLYRGRGITYPRSA